MAKFNRRNHDGQLFVAGDMHGNRKGAEKIARHAKEIHEESELDAILLAGDIGGNFLPLKREPTEGQRFLWKQDVLAILEIFGEIGVPVIWTLGNHDHPDAMSILGATHDSARLVDRSMVQVGNWSIVGLGGSPKSFGWPHEWEEQNADKFLTEIGSADVLLTHTPPFSVLDSNIKGTFCGSKAVLKHAHKYNFVVCGHIHEAFGVRRYGEGDAATMVGNAGSLGRPHPKEHFLLLRKEKEVDVIVSRNLESGWERTLKSSGQDSIKAKSVF